MSMREKITPLSITMMSALVCVCLVGCSDYRGANERNPYYQKAEAARHRGDYDAAEGFYVECLKFSPESCKAHLQLGIIYEENRKDYPRAITHYQEYLKVVGNQNEDVTRMLNRVEKMYMTELTRKFMKRSKPLTPRVPVIKPQVSARAEPINRSNRTLRAESSSTRNYVVQEGDNLSGISNKVYGTAKHWNAIFEANRGMLPTPERLKVGQRLKIPEIN